MDSRLNKDLELAYFRDKLMYTAAGTLYRRMWGMSQQAEHELRTELCQLKPNRRTVEKLRNLRIAYQDKASEALARLEHEYQWPPT